MSQPAGHRHTIATTETILSLVIVAMIAALAVYVLHIRSDANKSYDAAAKSNSQTAVTTKMKDESCVPTEGKTGLTMDFGTKGMNFCLPNGWMLYGNSSDKTSVWADAASLQYAAKVTPMLMFSSGATEDGPSDFRMSIAPSATFKDAALTNFKSITPPVTQHPDHMAIAAYYRLTTKNDPVTASTLSAGTEQYRYVVVSHHTGETVEVTFNATKITKSQLLPQVQALVSSICCDDEN